MSHIEQEFQQIESEHGWNRLFSKLDVDQQKQTIGKKFETALSHINRSLNRFRDVLPYDDTRVCLKKGSNDYINANYVQIPSANRKYILTQGPLQTTSGHFWQMIWQENSRVIVMLTRLMEKGSNKCWLYYPDGEIQNELLFEDVNLKVILISERQYRHYTQRKLKLIDCLTNESRSIIHWSEFDWPDHSVPTTSEPFLQFLRDVRYSGAFDSRYGAPVLHCSAGIGRSGTFVLVDSILKLFAQSKTANEISLIDIVSHIRTQRHGLIQTAEQLRFSYVTIIAGLKNLNEIEESEKPFIEYDFSVSSDSESDDNNENEIDLSKSHPKVCGRQDNIMPNSRLSDTLEDINCDLMRRAESNASFYQLSPISSQRLLTLANEQNNHNHSQTIIQDSETSVRFRQERSIQNENIEKKIHEIKTKLQTCSSSSTPTDNRLSLIHLLTTKYRHSFLFGLFTFFTGSFLLYKYFSNNNRNH